MVRNALNETEFRAGRRVLALLMMALLPLGACDYADPNSAYPEGGGSGTSGGRVAMTDSVFGPSGLSLGGSDKQPGSGEPGVGVNSFLWRASLDTVSFMPLVSADPFGGVIITDWYSPPKTPDQRLKVNVYILGRTLRADGIRVAVFRQELSPTSGWTDATVADNTATELENAILSRARQLRIAQLGE